MVMPRCFSSGALSICSKATSTLAGSSGTRLAKTLVMAAVRVVLPWSTWPIVPTFRCGLFRTNFSLAMGDPPLGASNPVYDRLADLGGNRSVTKELHRERRSPLGQGTNVRGITEHRAQGNLGGDCLSIT